MNKASFASKLKNTHNPFTDGPENKVTELEPDMEPNVEPNVEPIAEPLRELQQEPETAPSLVSVEAPGNHPETDRVRTDSSKSDLAIALYSKTLQQTRQPVYDGLTATERMDRGIAMTKRKTKPVKYHVFEDQDAVLDDVIKTWNLYSGDNLTKSGVVRDMLDEWIADRQKQLKKRFINK